MKKKKVTAGDVSRRLGDIYTSEELYEQYEYLTNPSRGKFTSKTKLRVDIAAGQIGYLIKKLDPIAYEIMVWEF